MGASERSAWIDRWKGLLILLVVAGHVAGSVAAQVPWKDSAPWQYVYKTIYLFHMPAFFFLSGMLFHPDEPLRFLVRRAKRLIVPYLVLGVFSILVFQVMEGGFHRLAAGNAYWSARGGDAAWVPWVSLLYGAPLPGTDGFRCNSVLWFLPCLFTMQLLLLALVRLPRAVCLLFGAASPFFFVALNRIGCPSLPWGLSAVPKFFVFAVAGWAFSAATRRSSEAGLCRLVAWTPLYLLLCLFVDYSDAMYGHFGHWLVIVAMGFAGIWVSAGVAKVVKGRWLELFGVLSIGVMLFHKFPLLALQLKVAPVKALIAAGGSSSFLGAAVLLVGASLVSLLVSLAIHRWTKIF